MYNTIHQYEEVTGITLEEYIEGGGLAGEFNRNYYRWDENPTAFYESMTYPYATIYDDIVDERHSKKVLPAVYDEMERIRIQAENKDETKDGYFKIGTVELTIPPIQISVNEVKQNYTYKTLRTDSDIVFQSGKSMKIVELDIYFHDIDDINNKLRPLLAQLKCTPFVPIYSEYLRELLTPRKPKQIAENKEKRVKAINEANSKIALIRKDLIETIRKDKRLMESKPNLINDIKKYWDGSLSNFNSSGLDPNKSLYENMKKVLVEAEIPDTFFLKGGVLDTTYNVEAAVRVYKNDKNKIFSEMKSVTLDSNIVGVLSQLSIATAAGFPESLICHATFFMFNYYPFSERFEFLDSNNKSTIDIDKCLYFTQWYASRFLNQGSDNNRFFSPLNGVMNGDMVFEYVKEEASVNAEGGKVPVGKSLEPVALDEDTVCAAIVVSQKNSLSFLPVLQWSVPTCQYLGAHNASVSITIDTISDDFIERIKYMIDVCEKSAREGDKVARSNYITVDNEVLALAGIRNCVVEGIKTSTVEGSPGMTRIQLDLIEFNPEQLADEVITRYKEVPEKVQLEYFSADVQQYLDTINFKDHEAHSKTPLEKILEKDDLYRHAAGQETVLFDESAHVGFSLPEIVPSQVYFNQDEKRLTALKNIINKQGLHNVDGSRRVERGIRVSGSEGKETFTAKYTYIMVKDSESSQERKYNYLDKTNVAKYMKYFLSNTSHIKRVEEIDKDILYLLYKTDELRDYRKDLIDNMKSFLNGTGGNLPEYIEDRLSRSKALLDTQRRSTRYPDMYLPTYITTKRVGVGAPEITYAALGKASPKEQTDSPRSDGDIVEPDFYFKNGVDVDSESYNNAFLKIFEDEYVRMIHDIGGNVDAQMREDHKETPDTVDDLLKTEALTVVDSNLKKSRSNSISYKESKIGPSLQESTAEENALVEESALSGKTYDPADDASDLGIAQRLMDNKQYYIEKGTSTYTHAKGIYGLNVDASKREVEVPEKKV